jgi:hypothetical protein
VRGETFCVRTPRGTRGDERSCHHIVNDLARARDQCVWPTLGVLRTVIRRCQDARSRGRDTQSVLELGGADVGFSVAALARRYSSSWWIPSPLEVIASVFASSAEHAGPREAERAAGDLPGVKFGYAMEVIVPCRELHH